MPGERSFLSQEQTERSRTIPSFRKKNKRTETFLKMLERFVKQRIGNF